MFRMQRYSFDLGFVQVWLCPFSKTKVYKLLQPGGRVNRSLLIIMAATNVPEKLFQFIRNCETEELQPAATTTPNDATKPQFNTFKPSIYLDLYDDHI